MTSHVGRVHLYGLVDSPKVRARPGQQLNLTAVPSPNELGGLPGSVETQPGQVVRSTTTPASVAREGYTEFHDSLFGPMPFIELPGELLGFPERFGTRDFCGGARKRLTCGSAAKTGQFESREPAVGALGAPGEGGQGRYTIGLFAVADEVIE